MGCGVSKEDIAEPSRIQSVAVRAGSPESHLKSHEIAAQNAVNTTPVTQGRNTETSTPCCTSPVSDAIELTPSSTAPRAAAAVIVLQDDDHVANGTPVLPLPTSNGGDSGDCTKSPEGKASARTSNGLVGTLASVEEILNAKENVSIKSKSIVTAEKILSYGGVLRSLENTVELQEAQQQENGDREAEEQENGNGQLSLISRAGIHSACPGSPANLPSLEASRKKLPPLTTPSSFMIDKGTDPFVKAPLPTQLVKPFSTQHLHVEIPRASPTDLMTPESAPSSANTTTTETVMIENVKDITVMNGAAAIGLDQDKCSSPQEWTSLEDLHSEDADLENIILLETLEAGDANGGEYGSRVNHINHNMRVTSLTSELGVSANGQQRSPYSSSCSNR